MVDPAELSSALRIVSRFAEEMDGDVCKVTTTKGKGVRERTTSACIFVRGEQLTARVLTIIERLLSEEAQIEVEVPGSPGLKKGEPSSDAL